MTTEADSRILIDKLLEQAGWPITNKAHVSTEEAAADGRADYLLKDTRSRPLAVLEAKRFAVDPYTAKEQARVRLRKTIVFAVSEKQASILVRLFNKLLSDEDCLRIAGQINRSPSEVRQSFAKKITCHTNNGNPKPVIDEFKYDPLPLIAVSVDMLDTGYDQKDIENLIMLRPTRSPIKYAQMRGRGSRLCPKIGKEEFIYDFVGNSKRFNDPGERYDKPKLVGVAPGSRPAETGEIEEGDVPQPGTGITYPYPEGDSREFLIIAEGSLDDEIRTREIILVGPEGLAMDRKTYREEWEKKVLELKSTDPAVEKIFRGDELTDEEWEALARRLNSPRHYFNEDTLRRAFEQPTGSLTDFIRVTPGLDHFLSRDERIEKAFNAWVSEHSSSINPAQAQMLRLLKARVMTGEEITMRLFSQPPFSLWGGLTRMEQLFGKEQLLEMVQELNFLREAAIPLPPIDEQRRIVARIEELTRRVEEARKLGQETVAQIATQFLHVRRKVYQSLLSDFPAKPLGKCGKVMGGGTPSKKRDDYWHGDIPWVAPKEMKTFRITASSEQVTETAISESSVKLIPAGSVLFVVRGMILAPSPPRRLRMRF